MFGGHMNAKITGCGDLTLVLAHGYGGSQSVWDCVLPDLAKRYRVVVFDWNFSGAVEDQTMFEPSKYSSLRSFSDDLISLLDELNLKSTVYVGHSMAGMIGCVASIGRPDLFTRLVLVGSSPRYLNAEDYEGGFEKIEVDNIFRNIESNFQAWADDFVRLVIGANDPISIKIFSRDLKRMKPEVALTVARAVFLSDLRDVLQRVETPCTIVQSSNDSVVPLSVSHYMKSKIKGEASLEMVEMDGHFPQLTAPRQFIDVVHRILMSDTQV